MAGKLKLKHTNSSAKLLTWCLHLYLNPSFCVFSLTFSERVKKNSIKLDISWKENRSRKTSQAVFFRETVRCCWKPARSNWKTNKQHRETVFPLILTHPFVRSFTRSKRVRIVKTLTSHFPGKRREKKKRDTFPGKECVGKENVTLYIFPEKAHDERQRRIFLERHDDFFAD